MLCGDATLDAHAFCFPAERLEKLLRADAFQVLQVRPPSSGTNGSKTMFLSFPDDHLVIKAKWKQAHPGAVGFNNDPRKELAAFAVQKLFLAPDEWVVPPTVGRCIPSDFYSAEVTEREAKPTFPDAQCVFGVLSYWIENVHELGALSTSRFARDPAYRRNVATLNLFTYVIDHRDTRESNFIVSKDDRDPHAFSIDNGLAFSGFRNPRALFVKEWADIVVPSLLARQVDRLRKITREDLQRLAVVAQFEVRGGQIDAVPPTAPIDTTTGVRRKGAIIQLGLTQSEIDGIDARIHRLLERIDAHQIALLDDQGRALAKR